MIRKNDIVTFKPEWRDAGDETLTFVARDNEENGLVRVSVLEFKGRWAIWPTQTVRTSMIE